MINNTSHDTLCYRVEFTSGAIPGAKICPGGIEGHLVKTNETVKLVPTGDFIGAITGWSKDGTNVRGSRSEFRFGDPAFPGAVFYDITHELGISNFTLGPADHHPRLVYGKNVTYLAGQKNCVAQANRAWSNLTAFEKTELLAYPAYFKLGANGNLTHVGLDSDAPVVARNFFQKKAHFHAYEDPGSEAGKTSDELDREADKQTLFTDTEKMVITAY